MKISQHKGILLFWWLLLAAGGNVSCGFIQNRYISSLCSKAEAWTLLASEHECRKFYVCTGNDESNYGDNNYQEFSCTWNYHFSREQQHCVYGPCSDNSTTSTIESSTCSSKVERQPGDCSKYRLCSRNGAYALIGCKQGTYFDVKRRACLPIALTPEHQCACLLPEYSTLRNPNDCETYYRCEGGEAVLIQCPKDEYYENSVHSCLLDTTGICFEEPTLPPPAAGRESLALQQCARTGSDVVPHASDCSRYYVCKRGRVLEMSCPYGRYFHPLKRFCALDVGMQCPNNKVVERNHEISELPIEKHDETTSSQRENAWKLTSFDKLSSKFVSFQ